MSENEPDTAQIAPDGLRSAGHAAIGRRVPRAAMSTSSAVLLSLALHVAGFTAMGLSSERPRASASTARVSSRLALDLDGKPLPRAAPIPTRELQPLEPPPTLPDPVPLERLPEEAQLEPVDRVDEPVDLRGRSVRALRSRVATASAPDPAIEPVASDVVVRASSPAPADEPSPGSEETTAHAPVPAPGNPAPRYPGVARRRGYEGLVVLAVQVAAAGDVTAVTVASSSGHALLDRAARQAVLGWSFHPATEGGRPVAGTAEVTIHFQLTD